MKALKTEFEFEIINLGSGRPITLKKFIKLIERLTKKEAKIELLPDQPGDVKQTYASTRKATNLLKFSAKTPLKKGMKEFIEWFRKKRFTRTNSRLQNSNLL